MAVGDVFSGLNLFKIGTILLEAIAIGLMAVVFEPERKVEYEKVYLAFLCIPLIVTFLYLLIVVALAVVSDPGTFDKVYHVLATLMVLIGWILYLVDLADIEPGLRDAKNLEQKLPAGVSTTAGKTYDKQIGYRSASLVFSGLDWMLLGYITFKLVRG